MAKNYQISDFQVYQDASGAGGEVNFFKVTDQ
jgi:hypothetical protein